jgi:hypothetical protein
MDEQQFVDMIEMTITLLTSFGITEKETISFSLTDNSLPFLDFTEVRPSDTHGNGVFAKEDIEAGKVVSMYPCHGYIQNGYVDYCTKHKRKLSQFDQSKYKIGLSDDTSIFGIPTVYSTGINAHLINDSYPRVNDLANITTPKKVYKNYIKYMENAIQNENCMFVGNEYYIYMKTTKPIYAGDELLCSYGFGYWAKGIDDFDTMINKYLSPLSKKRRSYFYELEDRYTADSAETLPASNKVKNSIPLLTSPEMKQLLKIISFEPINWVR